MVKIQLEIDDETQQIITSLDKVKGTNWGVLFSEFIKINYKLFTENQQNEYNAELEQIRERFQTLIQQMNTSQSTDSVPQKSSINLKYSSYTVFGIWQQMGVRLVEGDKGLNSLIDSSSTCRHDALMRPPLNRPFSTLNGKVIVYEVFFHRQDLIVFYVCFCDTRTDKRPSSYLSFNFCTRNHSDEYGSFKSLDGKVTIGDFMKKMEELFPQYTQGMDWKQKNETLKFVELDS